MKSKFDEISDFISTGNGWFIPWLILHVVVLIAAFLIVFFAVDPCFGLSERCQLHMDVTGGCTTCVTGYDIERGGGAVFFYLCSKERPCMYVDFKETTPPKPDEYYVKIVNEWKMRDICPELYAIPGNPLF